VPAATTLRESCARHRNKCDRQHCRE
jgi:hypothetical protein